MKTANKKQKEEPSNYLLFLFMIIILLRNLRRFVSFLTQYFPFSLLSERFYIHNKNKEQNIAWGFVHDEAYKLGMSPEIIPEKDDQHFIYFRGKFTYIKKGAIEKLIAKIQEAMGETNFYVKKIDEKNFTFMFAKGSVNEAKKLGKIKFLI